MVKLISVYRLEKMCLELGRWRMSMALSMLAGLYVVRSSVLLLGRRRHSRPSLMWRRKSCLRRLREHMLRLWLLI